MSISTATIMPRVNFSDWLVY